MPEQSSGVLPITLKSAVWLLSGQAVALAALAVTLGVATASGRAQFTGAGLGEALLVAVLAVVLAGLAYALRQRRRWARGPSIVLELLLCPIGYNLVVEGRWWLGVPVVALGLLGAGLLLTQATSEALT